MAYCYNFPKVRADKATSVMAQCWKVMEETTEVEKEVVSLKLAKMRNEPLDFSALVRETLDCIHACETMLHILIDGKMVTQREIDNLKGEVIGGNMARGYYADGSR